MIPVLLSAVAIATALAAPRWLGARFADWFAQWEEPLRKRGPLVLGLVSVAVVWFTWDALVPVPKVHDENSYLLQADIFARLRWTVPSPPIPEFFEQPHVQVVPAVASKYPPGHALLLTLGSLVGFHPLVPLLLTGFTAAMVFKLATRLTDVWTGVLTWLAWTTAPIVLRFQPGYFSEVTTTALVLLSWWLLLDWRETHRRGPLLWMALAIGWGAITRPLTMLALAIPIGVVVLRDTVRMKTWRDLGLAFAIGVAVLSILPLWSWRTTGNWRVSPVEQWRLDYQPFDKLGFETDMSAPRRELSAPLAALYRDLLIPKSDHSLATLPRTAADRALHVTIAFFQKARLPLVLFALVGLALAWKSPVLRFGIASCVVLFVSYLPYSYWNGWTIYFLETAPVASAVIAIGIAWVARRIHGDAGARGAMALTAGVVALLSVQGVLDWRTDHRVRALFYRVFKAQVQALPSQHAIVFVKYSSRVAQNIAVVHNFADLAGARVWVVHDRGARNDELRRLAPDRASFDFDEDQVLTEAPPRR